MEWDFQVKLHFFFRVPCWSSWEFYLKLPYVRILTVSVLIKCSKMLKGIHIGRKNYCGRERKKYLHRASLSTCRSSSLFFEITRVRNFYAKVASANWQSLSLTISQSNILKNSSFNIRSVCFLFSRHNTWMYYILPSSEHIHEAWHDIHIFILINLNCFLTLLLFFKMIEFNIFFNYLDLLSPCLSILSLFSTRYYLPLF